MHDLAFPRGQLATRRPFRPTASLFASLRFRESEVDHPDQPLVLERLLEKIERPSFIASTARGTSPWPVMTMTGGFAGPNAPTQQFHAVDPRHAYVRDHTACLQIGKCIEENLRGGKTHAEAAEPAGNPAIAHRRVVVDDVTLALGGIGHILADATGSVKRKVTPRTCWFRPASGHRGFR